MGAGGSILPWDDWIYHVNSKKHEVKSLHNEGVSLQNSINGDVLYYNNLLTQVKQLTSGNAALVIIAKALQLDDLQLDQFQADLEALPEPPKGCIPAKFGSFLVEMTGSFLVLKGIVNLGKLAKSAVFGEAGVEGAAELGLEGLAETGAELGIEVAAEIGVEVGVEGVLAETGVGIIAAVGLDIIFGAINGAKEAKELDNQISKLRDAVDKLTTFRCQLVDKKVKLEMKAVQEETRFKGIVVDLQKIIPYKNAPQWDQLSPTLDALPTFMAVQSEAIRFYGLLSQLRITYIRAKKRTPGATKDAIIHAVLLKAQADVTQKQLEDIWSVLEKYSTGMKKMSSDDFFLTSGYLPTGMHNLGDGGTSWRPPPFFLT